MKKKTIFLILSLVLPVSVFLFLKIFGSNEFKVSVLHTEGSIDAPAGCPFVYKTPYRIPDSVIVSLNLNRKDSVHVFYFDPSLDVPMNRILVEFEGDPVGLVRPSGFSTAVNPVFLRDCILLAKPDSSIVLTDHRNRIRGYYDGTDRDEVDRLIVEIKIILKQY